MKGFNLVSIPHGGVLPPPISGHTHNGFYFMVKLLLMMLTLGGPEGDYDATKRYNDSLLIYNTYRSQINTLKTMKESDQQAWYDREANDDSLTVCAKLRLGNYNHSTYEPSETWEREGLGSAYGYPAPSTVEHETAQAFGKSTEPKPRYVVYDKQTHFLFTNKLTTIIPYIKKFIFDKGRLLYVEKLNPVTMEKLEEPIEDLEKKMVAVLKK
jgi:hypothetical protein